MFALRMAQAQFVDNVKLVNSRNLYVLHLLSTDSAFASKCKEIFCFYIELFTGGILRELFSVLKCGNGGYRIFFVCFIRASTKIIYQQAGKKEAITS